MREGYIDSYYKPSLGTLSSGEVVVDRDISHIASHGIEPDVVREVLQNINAKQRLFLVETVTLTEIVGVCNCVETLPDDEIVYAKRIGRTGSTRFVKNRSSVPSNQVTVALRWDKGQKRYECVTAYIGPRAEVEPFDPRADDVAIEFWENHALVWGSQAIDEETVTEAPK